jgi:hypothetical protein
MADVVAGDDEVLALIVAAANDDVCMRMTGVEMIDGHPVKLAVGVEPDGTLICCPAGSIVAPIVNGVASCVSSFGPACAPTSQTQHVA